jgi:hypothetical protein
MSCKKLVVLFFCAAVFSAGGVFAQDSDSDLAMQKFQAIDANSDGFITPEEMQVYQTNLFDKLDKNKDDELDQEELKADTAQSFKDADRNGDTRINRQEAFSQFNDYFNRMDCNKDSNVSGAEFREYWPVQIKF